MRPLTTAATSLVLGATALSLLPQAALADESPLEQLNAQTQSAIVYLETTWSGQVFDTYRFKGERQPEGYVRKQPFSVTSRCTGFVVNPDGYIVTAGHCVEPTEEIEQKIIEQAALWTIKHTDKWSDDATVKGVLKVAADDFRVDGRDHNGRPDRSVVAAMGIALSGESSGSVLPARVLALRGFDKGDVAMVKVEAENLPALQLAEEPDIDIGTEVVSIGYPLSVDLVTDATFDPSYKDGQISSSKTIDNGLLDVYEVSAPVSGGMSGGPTVDSAGEVVGLNSFGIAGESQPFNFIRPTSIIEEMLNDKGVTNEIGPVQQRFDEGLDAYAAGDKEGAMAAFDEVLAQSPSHQLAQEYRGLATQLPDAPQEESGLGTTTVLALLLGAGVLLMGAVAATAGLTFWLVRRGRSAVGGPATA